MVRSNVPPEAMWCETYNVILLKKKKKTEPELGQGCRTEFQLKKKKHVEKQIKHHLKETDSSGHSTGQLIGIFNKSITRIKRNTMDLNRIPIWPNKLYKDN